MTEIGEAGRLAPSPAADLGVVGRLHHANAELVEQAQIRDVVVDGVLFCQPRMTPPCRYGGGLMSAAVRQHDAVAPRTIQYWAMTWLAEVMPRTGAVDGGDAALRHVFERSGKACDH